MEQEFLYLALASNAALLFAWHSARSRANRAVAAIRHRDEHIMRLNRALVMTSPIDEFSVIKTKEAK